MANRIEENSFNWASSIYAPLYKRIAAFIIDAMVIYGGAISFYLGFKVVSGRAWIMLFAAFFSWLYFSFFYCKGGGQTIGGKAFGIKVISVDGSVLGFWRALSRSVLISSIISPLGFVAFLAFSFILFSLITLNVKPTRQRRQTLWDAATKSCVTKGGTKFKFGEW
jgi:uncharacterized RDD family membrane protein YckC